MSLFCKKSILILILLSAFSFVFARSKADAAKDNPENNYIKLIHPREYIFDFCDAKEKVVLKFDDSTGKLKCNVDFTELVKNEMPRKGDKITFKFEGTASKDIMNVTAFVYDLKKSLNLVNKTPELLVKATQKGAVFSNTLSVILTENAESSFVLVLTSAVSESNKKTDKVELKFKRICNSTDTKIEAEQLKKAIKEKKNIIEIKGDFAEKSTDVVKQVDFDEDSVEETEEESPEENVNDLENEVDIESEEENEQDSDIDDEIEETQEEQESQVEENSVESSENIAKSVNEDKSENEKQDMVQENTIENIEQNPSLPEPKNETSVVNENANITENKIENTVSIPNPKVITEKEIDELKSSVSRYKKEYLQDYAVSDKIVIDEPDEYNFDIIENPNETDSFGRTQLMNAAKGGNDWQIKNLIDSGADVNLRDKEGWTALMYAVRYQENLNCVELLIDAGADIKAVNKFDTSALKMAACYNNNPVIIKKLLSYYSASEKEVLCSFVLLITENHTSEYLQLAKLKIFLESSIPVNNFYNGKTPLMYAAEFSNSTKVIKLLLDYDAVTSIRSTENKTAFDYAKENTNLKHDTIYWSLNKK